MNASGRGWPDRGEALALAGSAGATRPPIAERKAIGDAATARPERAARALAVLFLFALSLRIPGFGLLPVAAAIAPLFLRRASLVAREVPHARALVVATATAVAFGIVLRIFDPDKSHGASLWLTITVILWFAGMIVLGLCTAASLQLLGIVRGLAAYGVGSLVGNASELGLYDNWAAKWKFALAAPTILLLLLAMRRASIILLLAVTLVVVGVSLEAHARSASLVMVIAVVAAIAAGRRQGGLGNSATRRLALVVLAPTLALALSGAMTQGLLGTELQSLQQRQEASGQSILVGGRTEYAASLDLAGGRPLGYGVGARPSDEATGTAVRAAGAAGADIFGPYFLASVFGTRVDLHSSLSNSWFHFGLAGLLVMILVLATLTSAVLKGALSRAEGAAAAYLVLLTGMFDVYGSPMLQGNRIAMALGMALVLCGARR